MIFDNPYDYLAGYLTIDEVVPYKQYESGAKDAHDPVYKDDKPYNSNPVLRLDDDIVNNDGYGLQKGFYELRPDNDFKFLMFIQSGVIRAKIPIISYERISEYGNDYEWPDKKKKDKNAPNSSSAPLKGADTLTSPIPYYPPLSEKQKKKRKKMYKKGEDPVNYIHSIADISFDPYTNSYLVIWEKYNIKIKALIKL